MGNGRSLKGDAMMNRCQIPSLYHSHDLQMTNSRFQCLSAAYVS